jgi:hypothetical protein
VITKEWLEALKDIEETAHEKDLPFVESAAQLIREAVARGDLGKEAAA